LEPEGDGRYYVLLINPSSNTEAYYPIGGIPNYSKKPVQRLLYFLRISASLAMGSFIRRSRHIKRSSAHKKLLLCNFYQYIAYLPASSTFVFGATILSSIRSLCFILL